MENMGKTNEKERPLYDGSVKTAKVILNVVVALVVAVVVDFIVGFLLVLLLELPFLYKLIQWFTYSFNPYWPTGIIAAVLAACVSVWVLGLINKNTELEKILSGKIAGWILVVLSVFFIILDLVLSGNVVPGDISNGVMGLVFLSQHKLGLYKAGE